jgi:hypothetical protein
MLTRPRPSPFVAHQTILRLNGLVNTEPDAALRRGLDRSSLDEVAVSQRTELRDAAAAGGAQEVARAASEARGAGRDAGLS